MGLDAYVACNCYRDGKTPRPPFADKIMLDENGELGFISPADVGPKEWQALAEWKRGACAHRDMWFASERIGTWGSVGVFSDMMELVGWDRFPSLRQSFGESTQVSAHAATRILEDLNRFDQLTQLGDIARLVDVETGDLIAEYIGRGSAAFMMRGHIEYAMDAKGFIVRSRQDNDHPHLVLFRSTHFRQEFPRKVGTDSARHSDSASPWHRGALFLRKLRPARVADEAPTVDFIDCDTGIRLPVHMAIEYEVANPDANGRMRKSRKQPHELRVGIRQATPSDFSYIVGCLTRLCEASVETGNPICWC
jgi:hypothetical protein